MSEFYANRLAQVSVKNPVTVGSDIFNAQGGLILAKGSQLLEKQARIIAQHKLVKPLEQSVEIEKSLDGAALYAYIRRFIESIPGLTWILTSEPTLQALEQHCNFYGKFPLLRQKLTVLAGDIPELYQKALYCAVAGVAIATKLKLTEQEKQTVFIGGLMHDVGFLHLPAGIDINKSDLNDEFSSEIQAHPIIAKKFLDQIPNLPKQIGKAVLDHHERSDGTGYPAHKMAKDLAKTSMIIATCDRNVDSFLRCKDYPEHVHDLIKCILQLNGNVYNEEIYNATAVLFNEYQCPPEPPKNPPNLRQLISHVDKLNAVFTSLKKLSMILAKKAPPNYALPIIHMTLRLELSMSESGMNIPEYKNWIEDNIKTPNPEEHLGLLKSKIMGDEIEIQLRRLLFFNRKSLPSIKEDNPELFDVATKTLANVDKRLVN